jgi:hypothetical protein
MTGVNGVFIAMLAAMGLIFLVGWIRIRWDE